MKAFTKGGKRPGAGRKPGVPNKATAEARETIRLLVEGNVERLQGWINEVAARDRAKAADIFYGCWNLPCLSSRALN